MAIGYELSVVGSARQRSQTPDCTMKSKELIARERLRPFQECAGSCVHGGHRSFLVFGQRHDSEREDLVDLGAVEQVAGTLRGDLRIVIEDDRR